MEGNYEKQAYDPRSINKNFFKAIKKGSIEKAREFLNKGALIDIRENGLTPLMHAAQNGRTALAIFLVNRGAQINPQKMYSLTALHLAAKKGHKDIVAFLLSQSAHVNVQDKQGSTPLHLAAQAGNEEVVALLLNHGSIINVQDKQGNMALRLAIRANHKGVVNLLLSGGTSIGVRDLQGNTPLMLAVKEGHYDLVAFLIDKGADIHAVNNSGTTVLMLARKVSTKEIVTLLKERGADAKHEALLKAIQEGDVLGLPDLSSINLNVQDSAGHTALTYAVKKGNKEIVYALLNAGANIHSKYGFIFRHAARCGDLELLVFLLKKYPDINTKDYPWASLRAASIKGKNEVVFFLLNKCSACIENINAKNSDGDTILLSAAAAGEKEIVEMLLDKGADIDAQNLMGETALIKAVESYRAGKELVALLLNRRANIHVGGGRALQTAALHGCKEKIILLLSRGAHINAKDSSQMTALMSAAEEVIPLLLENGADVHIQDKIGRTALIVAAGSGESEKVKMILDAGADANAQDENGKTALMCAAGPHMTITQAYKDVITLLLSRGASINTQDKNDMTALMHAIDQGNEEPVIPLLKYGTDITIKDKWGRTAFTINKRNNKRIQQLLEIYNQPQIYLYLRSPIEYAKQNKFMCTAKGQTILMLACIFGHAEVISLLKDCAVGYLNARDNYDYSAFDYAIRYNLNLLSDLINTFGPNINELNLSKDSLFYNIKDHQETLLAMAVEAKNSNLINDLLNIGADIDVQDKQENTPLMLAAERAATEIYRSGSKAYEELVKLLLNRGASITIQDKNGYTALHHAISNISNDHLLTLLLKEKFDITIRDKFNYTIFDRAVKRYNASAIKVLIDHFGLKIPGIEEYRDRLLMDAVKRSHNLALVNALLAVGAKPTVQLIQKARQMGYLKIMYKLLLNYLVSLPQYKREPYSTLNSLFK